MRLSVVISTYNSPQALEKCLWGYCCQTHPDFEVLVADDGSDDETCELIRRFQRHSALNLIHVWQEHRGYRKARILNQAIRQSTGDYLIFTDGDCVPRCDFVAAHHLYARPNTFVVGGSHINIPERIHRSLRREDVEQQRLFQPRWLRAQGMNSLTYGLRLTTNPWLAACLNRLTQRAGVFVGCNGSVWKSDLLTVNGFDESLTEYGTEDKNLGLRLTLAGVRSQRLKYSLVNVHLAHPRPYYSPQLVEQQMRRLKRIRAQRIVRIPQGLRPLAGHVMYTDGG